MTTGVARDRLQNLVGYGSPPRMHCMALLAAVGAVIAVGGLPLAESLAPSEIAHCTDRLRKLLGASQ